MLRRVAFSMALCLLTSTLSPAAAEGQGWLEPVRAPVVDPFRKPTSPWGAGNRGWEYHVPRPQQVLAAGSGVVVFAGSVGGTLHVTLLHGDGIKTSYSFLDRTTVRIGDLVSAGRPLGWVSGPFHFSVRRDGEYVDPGWLFGERPPSVRLVPDGEMRAASLRAWRQERAGFARLVLAEVLERASGAARVARALLVRLGRVERIRDLLDLYRAMMSLRPEVAVGLALGEALAGWAHKRGRCTPSSVAPPRQRGRRIAVLVGGLGSSSGKAAVDSLDVGSLGYRPEDVLRFSYEGGRVPSRGPVRGPRAGAGTDIEERAYSREDTHEDLTVSAGRLAALVTALGRRHPGGAGRSDRTFPGWRGRAGSACDDSGRAPPGDLDHPRVSSPGSGVGGPGDHLGLHSRRARIGGLARMVRLTAED